MATLWLKYGAFHAYHGTVGQANHDYHTELEVNNTKLLRVSFCIILTLAKIFVIHLVLWISSVREIINWERLDSFLQLWPYDVAIKPLNEIVISIIICSCLITVCMLHITSVWVSECWLCFCQTCWSDCQNLYGLHIHHVLHDWSQTIAPHVKRKPSLNQCFVNAPHPASKDWLVQETLVWPTKFHVRTNTLYITTCHNCHQGGLWPRHA